MTMIQQKPSRPGWYWVEIPNNVPLQPALVFDGGDGFGLLYTLDRIDGAEDDRSRDGLVLDLATDGMLWSDEPIRPPTGRSTMTALQRTALSIVIAFGLGVLLTLEKTDAATMVATQGCQPAGTVDMRAEPMPMTGGRS